MCVKSGIRQKVSDNMAREDFISRQALLNSIKGFEILHHNDELRVNLIDTINNIPSAYDVRPVVRGKWIKQIEEDVDGELMSYWECSKCGRIEGHGLANIKDVIEYYPFCHCGADMREVEE